MGGISTIVVASQNHHKVEEIAQTLAAAGLPVQLRSLSDFGSAPEIEESAETFAGNAQLKAEGIASWLLALKAPVDFVLADDSGICIDALGGRPGVHSARFAGADATDADNNAKMVAELRALGLSSSVAYFCCVLALSDLRKGPEAAPHTHFFEGKVRGLARVEARGEGGFGYDPHVWIDGQSESYAELDPQVKQKISHRALALDKMIESMPPILRTEN